MKIKKQKEIEKKSRLVILLGESISKIKIEKSDIIFTQNYSEYNNFDLDNKIYLFDQTLCYGDKKLKIEIDKIFQSLSDTDKVFKNTFYSRLFLPLSTIIKQINDIRLKHDIGKLILLGGSDYSFMTLCKGEGETTKWLYKTSWLMNSIIKEYFHNELEICWIKKHSDKTSQILYVLRETFLRFKAIGSKIRNFIFNRNKEDSFLLSQSKVNVLALIDNPIQFDHINNLLIKANNINPIFILPSNMDCKNIKNKIFYNKISLFNLIKALCYIVYDKSKGSKYIKVDIQGKQFNLFRQKISNLFKQERFFYNCRMSELSDTLSNLDMSKISCVVTNMTFGTDIISINEFAHKNNIKHYNFQYVSMLKMLFPKMDLADRYFLYAKKTFDLYKQFSSTYELYLPTKQKPKKDNIQKEVITLSLFTQPDLFTNKYLNFINDFSEKISKDNVPIKLIIKPHYRQDQLDKFKYFSKKYDFIEMANTNDNCEKNILNSHIVLSMTSSVIFEALTLGKMAIIINIDKQYDRIIYEEDVCFPDINFVINTIEEVLNIVNNYDDYYKQYNDRYQHYFALNNFTTNYDKLFDDISHKKMLL